MMSSQRTTKLSLSRTQKKPENQGKINSFFDVKPKTANDVKSKSAQDVKHQTSSFAYDVEKEESTDEDEVEFIGLKPITPKVTR